MNISRYLLILAICIPFIGSADAEALITNCDRLAAGVNDVEQLNQIPSIPIEKIDSESAIISCTEAINANLKNPRYYYLLARAFEAKKDFKQAIKNYEVAGNLGYAVAQDQLGFIYYNGIGVATDYKIAFAWFKLAAEQNFLFGQYHLAMLYLRGHGAPRDENLAFKYMSLASDGVIPALTMLSKMYFLGIGVGRDKSKAIELINKSLEFKYDSEQSKKLLSYYNIDGLLSSPKDSEVFCTLREHDRCVERTYLGTCKATVQEKLILDGICKIKISEFVSKQVMIANSEYFFLFDFYDDYQNGYENLTVEGSWNLYPGTTKAQSKLGSFETDDGACFRSPNAHLCVTLNPNDKNTNSYVSLFDKTSNNGQLGETNSINDQSADQKQTEILKSEKQKTQRLCVKAKSSGSLIITDIGQKKDGRWRVRYYHVNSPNFSQFFDFDTNTYSVSSGVNQIFFYWYNCSGYIE